MRHLLLLRVVVLSLSLGLAAVTASAGSADGSAPARSVAEPPPVPSLEPDQTAALWRRLVAAAPVRSARAADCRPLRAVFYAATDWLRLATKLAERSSTCAEYYVSIPPLVADKSQPRRDQAWRIRALGPNFHPMAEISFAAWSRWVASTGSTWHAAGVTARQRMSAVGYDVSQGDIWSLNEISSAVRRGEGNARANIREFLRGLYEGDGTQPVRGAALVIGVGQRTPDLTVYQTTLQNWLTDSAFWTDMATYVSDWTQEVYGDVRSYAVPGVPASERREHLSDYLHHKLMLASVGPEIIEPARAYLREAFSPLANAAWERETGYGWTMVPVEQMAAYVSAQVHALRFFGAANGQPRDHWGFAWAPRNATGMSATDFAAQTSRILDRLTEAIRDSGEAPDPQDPGSRACGPPGQNVWCLGDLEGARLAEGWRSFRGWTLSVLEFGTPAQALVAGTPSAAMNLALVTSTGASVSTAVPLTVTVSSSSPHGTFSTSPAGPWSPTLTLTIAPGARTSEAFFYQDVLAGSHVLTATGEGVTGGVQPVTVTPGAPAALTVTPASGEVRARGSRRFSATGTDVYGNVVSGSFAWRVIPATLGTVAPTEGATTTFIAGRRLRSGRVVAFATANGRTISSSARVTVTPGQVRIRSLEYRRGKKAVRVTLTAVDAAGRPVPRAAVTIVVRRDGRRVFSGRAGTGSAGRTLFKVPAPRGCFRTAVVRVSAGGFTWNGRTPRNRFCG